MIRAAKIECIIKDDERKKEWRRLATRAQQVINRLWQLWEYKHINSAQQIRANLDAYSAWRDGGKVGKAPTSKLVAIDNEMAKELRRSICNEFPDVHGRVCELLRNKWSSNLTSRKSANSKLKGWQSILLNYEAKPSFTKPQPIPFDKQNSQLFVHEGNTCLKVRLDRDENGNSHADIITLMLKRKKTAWMRVIVNRIISGEYSFKGSALFHKKGKWFVSISYEMPDQKKNLDTNKVIRLIPGKKRPWVIVADGRKWYLGGYGDNIVSARKRLHREREDRKSHYRWSSQAQRGHGRKRAYSTWTKISSCWRNISVTYNRNIAVKLVQIAISYGCGKIIYHQPVDDQRDKFFLAKAGKDDRCNLSWEWADMGRLLTSACEKAGIEIEISQSVRPVPEDLPSIGKRNRQGRKASVRRLPEVSPVS